MDGTEQEPRDGNKKAEWLATNDQIVGALGTIVEPALQRELEKITNAKMAGTNSKKKPIQEASLQSLSQSPPLLGIVW